MFVNVSPGSPPTKRTGDVYLSAGKEGEEDFFLLQLIPS